MMPKDTNAHGTIFGGVILSNIDLASARRGVQGGAAPLRDQGDARGRVPRAGLSRAISSASSPTTVRVGRTSVTVRVEVEAERWGWDAARRGIGRGEKVKVTEAEVILVAVDAEGRPVPIRPEPVTA